MIYIIYIFFSNIPTNGEGLYISQSEGIEKK